MVFFIAKFSKSYLVNFFTRKEIPGKERKDFPAENFGKERRDFPKLAVGKGKERLSKRRCIGLRRRQGKRQPFQDRNQLFFWQIVNNIHKFSIYSCNDGVSQAELFSDQFRKMQLKLFWKRKQLLSSMSYRWRWCSSTIN